MFHLDKRRIWNGAQYRAHTVWIHVHIRCLARLMVCDGVRGIVLETEFINVSQNILSESDDLKCRMIVLLDSVLDGTGTSQTP